MIDGQRIEARIVGGLLAICLVDRAIAVIVLVVATHLDMAGVHGRIGVIAIAGRHAMTVGDTVAVGVAKHVIASLGGFDARVDGARPPIVAVFDRTLFAPDHRIANLHAVAKDSILAPGIVGHELAAMKIAVAGIERAVDAVVTLTILETGPAKGAVERGLQ